MNDVAVLQAAHRFQEMYVVIIKDSRDDFEEGATLDDFATLARTGMINNVQEPEATDTRDTTVAGYSAKEYVLNGTVDKIKVKYICSAVETPDNFYQIIAWTLPSRFDQNEQTLRDVIQTFKELKVVKMQE